MSIVRAGRASVLFAILGIINAACATAPSAATSMPTASTPAMVPTVTASLAPAATSTEGPDPTIDPWRLNASAHRAAIGERFEYDCSPNGSPSTIWGTDVYTDDSSVCTAAVHAGLITFAEGGQVTIEMRPGQDAYVSSERNGVVSDDYGAWGGSYALVTD